MTLRSFLYAAILACMTLGPLAAQTVAIEDVVTTSDAAAGRALPDVAPDKATTWATFANNAEGIVETGTASLFALTRIRAELVVWRDYYFAALDINQARLATIRKQLATLVPADGEELTDPVLIARRDELYTVQSRLGRPYVLANEAYVRASGLIAEADTQIRQREAARLMTRSPSPVNPAHWGTATDYFAKAVVRLGRETAATSSVLASEGAFWSRLFLVFIATVFSIGFLIRIRAWIANLEARFVPTSERSGFVVRFALSLGSVVLPIIGLVLLSMILSFSGFFGLTGGQLLEMLPVVGGLVFIAKWLSDWYFPTDAHDQGILGYDLNTRIKARRLVLWLSWVLAARAMVTVLLDINATTDIGTQVAGFPFQILLGMLLWRLGAMIAHEAPPDAEAIFKRNRIRKFIGRSAQAFSVLGPLASAAGYAAAAQSITGPAIISLALFATLVVFQRLSYALTSPLAPVEAPTVFDEGTEIEVSHAGLLPIIINTVLFLLSLPLLALLWGASPANLVEIWTRFRAGFAIGDIDISPSTFVTFVVVLVLGYLLTGAIKSGLKTSVLPRTRLDLGGQNAMVAGTGYLGISLSALAAFTFAGIDLSSLAIVAGALSVGIGFGLQNIVQNFVAGIILLIERPVSEGDMIEVGGQMGYVRDISVRSTRIETFDRTDVIVPNADLISNQVTNWTRGNLVGRVSIPVGVAYGSDTKQVTDILTAAIEANPMVLLNPPPGILLMQLGADSIDFEIRAIIRDVNFLLIVKSEVLHDIINRFDVAGIEIPFAQRDLWLRNPEALEPREGAE